MKLAVVQEKTNPHMKRKEISLSIEHDGAATPARDALRELAAKQFGFSRDHTDVRSIHSEGGMSRSRAKIFVWSEKKVEEPVKKDAKPSGS